jgi:UDP-glucuronate decarboxylase|tara:strand:+ start:6343 stop:7368 length:1026 start_codon:yes stop_codon:yes gene_type:complete
LNISTILTSDIKKLIDANKKPRLANKIFLITGGAGFIGSWLCEVLVSLNANVYCIDNLSSGKATNINHLKKFDNFTFKKIDIVKKTLNIKPDYILHLASRPSPDDYIRHPIESIIVNTEGTKKLLELARKTDSKLLFTSTSEVYGEANLFPTPETYFGNVNPSGPRSCYDESKRLCESLAMAYFRKYNTNIRIIRLFNTYGPRLRGDGNYGRALSRFILQSVNQKKLTVWGNGKQTRSFCYVTDIIDGILKSLTMKKTKGEIFNLGNPEETRIIDLAKTILKLTNSKSSITYLPMPEGDPKRRVPDITKAKNTLKFRPKVSLEQGLEKTLKWHIETKYKYL